MIANDNMMPDTLTKDAAATAPSTDFQRRVHCILGLPFDALTMEQAQAGLAAAIVRRRRCFLSTPNLNFLVGCLDDSAFRDSVLRSDMSVADGMPIIWIARALGIPVRERVAGSTLFERLRAARAPSTVFFFGGPEGVAQRAADVLNAQNGAMRCVGARSPGFGSITDMSSPALIDEINAARPDFLVVALGAKRGQAWIEHNLARLDAPLVSHLGAVVNFVAGTVARAPTRLGGLGLEWLWRIKEEPALWRRYRADGFALLRLLCTRVLPGAWHAARLRGRRASLAPPQLGVTRDGAVCRITLSGNWHEGTLQDLRAALQQATAQAVDIVLDLGQVSGLDSASVGLLILLFGHQSKSGRGFAVAARSKLVERTLHLNCAGYLLAPATP